MIHVLLQSTTAPIVITTPANGVSQLIQAVAVLLGSIGTVLGILHAIGEAARKRAADANTAAIAAGQTERAKLAGEVATGLAKIDGAISGAKQLNDHLSAQVNDHGQQIVTAVQTASAAGQVASQQIADVWKAVSAVSLAVPPPSLTPPIPPTKGPP